MPVPHQVELVGGGGHALVAFDAARAAGFDPIAFWDDDPKARLGAHLRHAGSIADLAGARTEKLLIIAIGGIASRRHVIEALGQRAYATIIHPRAIVSSSATIGPGTLICAGAIVNPHATIGSHAIINTGAIVEHECAIGSNVHLAPGSVLGGGVTIGSDTLVGLGASVLPLMKIGERCVIAAGAVVTGQIPDRATAIGVPARARAAAGKS